MALRAYEGKLGEGMSYGQSGASLIELISRPQRMPSDGARRILWLRCLVDSLMAEPQRSPRHDETLFELETRLRSFAAEFIAEGCEDADLHAWMGREAACGRVHSEAAARRLFCQAGVVAPPDSPGFGNLASLGHGPAAAAV